MQRYGKKAYLAKNMKETIQQIPSLWKRMRRIIRYYAYIFDDVDTDSAAQRIKSGIWFRGPNVWILAFAIVLASVGLNVNSTAVIIGAMLVSPLMGPIIGMGLSLGTNDLDLLKSAAKNLLVMVVISLAASTRLVGEDDSAEGAVEEFVLIEGTYGNGYARHCDVGTHNGVAGDAVDRGTQGSGFRLVEDITECLGDLLVAAAQLVGHLYLGQVEILSASAQLLKGYRILEEGRFGGVGRREPDGNRRTYGCVLGVLLGLVEIRPVFQFFVFRLVVAGEVAANCFH